MSTTNTQEVTGNVTGTSSHDHLPEVEWIPVGATIAGYVVFAVYYLLTKLGYIDDPHKVHKRKRKNPPKKEDEVKDKEEKIITEQKIISPSKKENKASSSVKKIETV